MRESTSDLHVTQFSLIAHQLQRGQPAVCHLRNSWLRYPELHTPFVLDGKQKKLHS